MMVTEVISVETEVAGAWDPAGQVEPPQLTRIRQRDTRSVLFIFLYFLSIFLRLAHRSAGR
jgi:hypothetical protein